MNFAPSRIGDGVNRRTAAIHVAIIAPALFVVLAPRWPGGLIAGGGEKCVVGIEIEFQRAKGRW